MVVVPAVLALAGVVELRRLDMPAATWALLPLTFVVAVAFSPAFLALRERHLRERVPA